MESLKMIQQTIVYLEDNLLMDIQLDTLARHIGETPFHLNQTFTMITGMNIEEYLTRRRLSEAAADLIAGKVSLLEIAAKYGYADAAAFNDAFRDYHGLSPLQARTHRQQLKQLNRLYVKLAVTEEPPLSYMIESKVQSRLIGHRTQIASKALYNHFLIADLLLDHYEEGKLAELAEQGDGPLYLVVHPHPYGLELFVGVASDEKTLLETEHLHHTKFAVFKKRGHLDYIFNEIWQSIEQQISVMLDYRKNDYYIAQLNLPLDFNSFDNKISFYLPIE
ncbi:helix-turn-helix domain-containing protein [Macrococcus carouselicus]|uniref:AraC family transcriptional regulator n=1 Tax=Macrococcus carouselicus TaxID=69969 RepID=A0A9Q8FRB6_9STAP|nr:helix-turn-helix domain-containing protein [Macrococcus carouselicus]TDM04311.1 AraC family transcriptional regulator [Macrococcus carouselicus]